MTIWLTQLMAHDSRCRRLARVRPPRYHGNVRRALMGRALRFLVSAIVMLVGPDRVLAQGQELLVRISEIQVDADYLQEYTTILKEEAEASVRLEPGVVAIFPMYQKDNRTAVRILEIYASRDAYESHLQTPHFQRYKTTTLKMVKSLKLVDMEAMDAETMTSIFEKAKTRRR
jgi:quinol monooxygenase YgiN